MKYLNAKDIIGLKFSIVNAETKHSLKTSFEWHKLGKPFGFFIRDEGGQLKKWNKENRTFTAEDENQYWYEDEEGKRKCYLNDVFGYSIILNGEDAQLNLSWAQNNSMQNEFKRVEDQIGVGRDKAFYTCSQAGRSYVFQYAGNNDSKVSMGTIGIKEPIDERTEAEKEICKAIKDSGKEYSYAELKETFKAEGLNDERATWLYETYMRKA